MQEKNYQNRLRLSLIFCKDKFEMQVILKVSLHSVGVPVRKGLNEI